jgi:uncharacterized protein YbjT (DUF2867 family)
MRGASSKLRPSEGTNVKVLVIGASGLTGRIAVRRLLERGDDVTAFARSEAGPAEQHERLRVAVGDARDAASIERAVSGQDAVFSAFGPRSMKKDDIQEAFMKGLVHAMERSGVRRLSNLSAWGAAESYPELAWFGKLVVRAFMQDFWDDKGRGEATLFASSLEYVNVRPGRLSNAAARGSVRASLRGADLRWWPLMTREDTAAFMIEQLTSDTWVRKSPLIGY